MEISGEMKALRASEMKNVTDGQTVKTAKGEAVAQTEPKAVSAETMEKAAVLDALTSFGIKGSDENVKLAISLIENNFQLTKENFQKLNQGIKLLGGEINAENISKVLFLMDNNISVTQKNLQAVDGFVKGETKLANQLAELAVAIDALPDGDVKSALIKAFHGNETLDAISKLPLKTESDEKRFTNFQRPPDFEGGESILESVSKLPLKTESYEKRFTNFQRPPDFEGGKSILEGVSKLPLKTESDERRFTNFQRPPDFEGGESILEGVSKLPLKTESDEKRFTNFQRPPDFEGGKSILEGVSKLPLKTESDEKRFTNFQRPPDFEGGESILEGVSKLPLKTESDEKRFTNFQRPPDFEGGESILEGVSKLPRQTDSLEALKTMSFKPNKSDPKEIDLFLNALKENIDVAKALITNEKTPEVAKIYDVINKIADNLDFIATTKNNDFVQLPLLVGQTPQNAELFVFRDKRQARKGGKATSAMIGLDTMSLGRFEVFVQKDEQNVVCDFRLADERVEKLVRQNLPKLNAMLEKHQFALKNYSFRQLEQAFNILSLKPDEEKNIKENVKICFDVKR